MWLAACRMHTVRYFKRAHAYDDYLRLQAVKAKQSVVMSALGDLLRTHLLVWGAACRLRGYFKEANIYDGYLR